MNPLERNVYSPVTGTYCRVVDVMTTDCIHCKQKIEGSASALGYPYHGLLHPRCVPYFALDGVYPHPHVVAYYKQASLDEAGTITPD